MARRFLRLALVGALLCAFDAPLALMQGYAWATMAAKAARSGSALAQTFDGRHPCAVCLAVKNAAHGPALKSAPPPRLDLAHQAAAFVEAAPLARPAAPAGLSSYPSRAAPPPVPPPDRLS